MIVRGIPAGFGLFAVSASVFVAATGLAQSQLPRDTPAVTKLAALAPGIHSETMRLEDGGAIRYAISIPPNYSPSARVPLVLALHYAGGPGSGRSMLEFLVRPAFAELGAIIVAPDSLRGDWSTPPNERGVNALLDAVLATYSIDAKKVAVTGYSMGGAGTWYWAANYPDRFTAAIPVAGRPTGEVRSWRVPVFAIHSRDDEVMRIGPTEQRIDELKKMGKTAEIVVLTGITHFQTDRHVDGLRRAVPWLKNLWK